MGSRLGRGLGLSRRVSGLRVAGLTVEGCRAWGLGSDRGGAESFRTSTSKHMDDTPDCVSVRVSLCVCASPKVRLFVRGSVCMSSYACQSCVRALLWTYGCTYIGTYFEAMPVSAKTCLDCRLLENFMKPPRQEATLTAKLASIKTNTCTGNYLSSTQTGQNQCEKNADQK